MRATLGGPGGGSVEARLPDGVGRGLGEPQVAVRPDGHPHWGGAGPGPRLGDRTGRGDPPDLVGVRLGEPQHAVAPTHDPLGRLPPVGMANSVMDPEVVIRPILATPY